jgi:hypothetical protein
MTNILISHKHLYSAVVEGNEKYKMMLQHGNEAA